MQNSQPPFIRQPYNSPSEIYLPEQPQAEAPFPTGDTSPDHPPTADQEIAIYYSQPLLTFYARLCKTLLIFLIVLFPFFLIAGFAFGGPFEVSDIVPLVLLVVVLCAAIFVLVWWVRVIGSLSGPTRKPVLHITHKGITIQNNIMVNYRVLPWNEIQTIDASRVHLKIGHVTPFSSHSDHLEQSRKGIRKKTVISLMYLDTPVQKMLRQISEKYASELRYYHIQFRP